MEHVTRAIFRTFAARGCLLFAPAARKTMHPPLFQPHPLCKPEVDALVACHKENPVAKFVNACGDAKLALDFCFKEEKKLRKKLNPKVSAVFPSALTMNGELRQGGGGGAGGGGAQASSSSSTTGQQ